MLICSLYRISGEEAEAKGPHEEPRHILEYNIKMGLEGKGCEAVD
jgi:hypothetical protein